MLGIVRNARLATALTVNRLADQGHVGPTAKSLGLTCFNFFHIGSVRLPGTERYFNSNT
jgi:hypothetical protein